MKKGKKRKKRSRERGKAKPLSDDVAFVTKYCVPAINMLRNLAPYHPGQEKEMMESADVLEKKILGVLPPLSAFQNVAYSYGRRPTYKEIVFEVGKITPSGEKPPSSKTVERICEFFFQVERRARDDKWWHARLSNRVF